MSGRKHKPKFRQPQQYQAAQLDHQAPEFMPDFSLSKQVALARREMGEARWAQLNQEWDA